MDSKVKKIFLMLCLNIAGYFLVLTHAPANATSEYQILTAEDFILDSEPGFGDRQNSVAWSMVWWKDHLYVGTCRAYKCVQQAVYKRYFPWWQYPPSDPDIECDPIIQDLPLRAEIWRWGPVNETWERVYQSPANIEIPDYPGTFVAPDIGLRDAQAFTEPDGTEALYFAGLSSRDFNGLEIPLPRILRSTDGKNFKAIPQDPSTFLGDMDNRVHISGKDHIQGFRSMAVYNGKLYVIAGGAYGNGAVLEAENPAGGNDNFRQVTPPDMKVYSLIPFNGYFYIGTGARALPPDANEPGFSVLKTDATGELPYHFIPVITGGGYLEPRQQKMPHPSKTVVHMEIFGGRLYVGTNQPAELFRINPDNSWDIVVGKKRMTPDGMKYPISGFKKGFGWLFNIHMHRLQTHDGVLYVGTNDHSTAFPNFRTLKQKICDCLGFDLYATTDGGWHFTQISKNGLGDMFNESARNFVSTPYGLFLGTQNAYYGVQIWRGSKEFAGKEAFSVPVERLEAESKNNTVVLSWEPPEGARRIRIFRSEFDSHNDEIDIERPDSSEPGSEPYIEIGTTNQFYFVDKNVSTKQYDYHYYVLAENDAGSLSKPSNLVEMSSSAPVITFDRLKKTVTSWNTRGTGRFHLTIKQILEILQNVHKEIASGAFDKALKRIDDVREMPRYNQQQRLPFWLDEDLKVLLAKLKRRISLVKAGIVSPSELE